MFDPNWTYPDVDAIDWPRHNPWDGEFLSDDQLATLLWFHWKRRPLPHELEHWKAMRGWSRYNWLNKTEIGRACRPTEAYWARVRRRVIKPERF